MISTKRFTVIKASAGSGKTYQLVKNYLIYALRPNEPFYFKHILAITFTIAAAREMKMRVLERLSEFANGKGNSDLENEICSALKISKVELQHRAEQTYTRMLHHYSELSIMTIDSFTHRLVRSFTKDLQINSDFNVEMDESLFREKIVDRMFEDLGSDPLLTQYVKDFTVDKLTDGKSWNPRSELIKAAKQIFKEDSAEPLEKLSSYDLQAFQQARKKITAEVKQFENEIIEQAKQALQLLDDANITKEDIPNKGSGYISPLQKLANGDFKTKISSYYNKALDQDNWLRKEADKVTRAQFETIKPQLQALMSAIRHALENEPYTEYYFNQKILNNLSTVGLLDRMHASAAEIRLEDNTLMLSDFHRMINDIVRENDAPFIYERIGSRYKHIMIDEFQDTSKTQWMNMIPLLQNGLAEGHESLVVGDAKQSIYRWRAGYVEQFISLPKLPDDFNMPLAERTFHENIDDIVLDTNFRSSRAVIEFNNVFYKSLAEKIPAYNEVYASLKQEKKKTDEGYVKITVNPNKKIDAEQKALTNSYILSNINEAISDGYLPGEITILVRTSKESMRCAELLTANQIECTTPDSFLLKRSLYVRALMGYMEFHEFPQHHFAAFDAAQALCEIHSHIALDTFISDYITKDKKGLQINLRGFLENYFGDLSNLMHAESVFHMATAILRKLKIPADSGVEYMLNFIKQQCINRNFELSQFIMWWKEKKEKLSVIATQHEGAVQIMTIHGAKGLEFPVTIVPLFRPASKTPENNIWMALDEQTQGLPVALIDAGMEKSDDSKSGETIHNAFTQNESNRIMLDSINVLYVATTRAAERMYIIREEGGNKFNNLVDQTLGELFPQYKPDGFFELGKREMHTPQPTHQRIVPVQFNGEEALFPTLKIITPKQADTPQMAYGKLLHESLSYIKNTAGLQAAIDRALQGRQAQQSTIEKLSQDVQGIVAHPQLATWFSAEGIVISEQEFCSESGEILRPDRVMVSNDDIAIIDYKSGVKQPKHVAQIETYKSQLGQIYNKPVQGFLVYTDPIEIVEV
jgi:ATP-dependent exoDNAse (exonuclease V) beta subunit